MSAQLLPLVAGLLPVLRELWSANVVAIADPALKALALKAMAAKMVALAGGAYGVQYLANSDWVRLLAIQGNLPTHTVDALGWAGGIPIVGMPFEFGRTLLVNYWFATVA